MAFSDIAKNDGLGRVLRCEVSYDAFATTTSFRWADRAGIYDGTNQWSRRIVSMSDVRRGFGTDRLASASTCSLVLENGDGGVDTLCGRSNIDNAAKARFRLWVGVYTPSTLATYADIQWRQLGEFVLSEWPRQSSNLVTLQLADDFMGRLGTGLQLPTIADWAAVGNTSNNPLKPAVGLPSVLTTDAVTQDLISEVKVEWVRPPETLEDQPEGTQLIIIPRNGSVGDGTSNAPVTFTTWTVEKSPSITKGGKTFQIIYLVVRADLGMPLFEATTSALADLARQVADRQSQLKYQGGYPPDAVDSIATPTPTGQSVTYARRGSRVFKWYVKGNFSAITNAPSTAFGIEHAADAVQDLVSVYSSASVDSTQFARVRAGIPFAACFGVVQAWTERANDPSIGPLPLSLRQVLTALAQSSDFDIFCNWSGQISLAADIYDFTVAAGLTSMIEFTETEIQRIERWVPSAGERGAAFNRVFFDGGRPVPAQRADVPFQGPFDLSTADIGISTRIVETVVKQGWRPYRQTSQNPVIWRTLDGRARDRVRFTTNLGGLRLELGDFFKLNWTRGSTLGSPYVSTIFQCESITYRPGTDEVEIEAVWRDDAQTERQYLLDNEALLVRTIAGATTATPSGAATVDIGGVTDMTVGPDVVAGDLLVLRDTTQAADVFTRNGAWRVTAVGDVYLTVTTNADGIYPAAGVVAAGQWSVVRGSTTYPTAVSDPTNYPSGGSMYGKVVNSGGLDSSGATGNRLVNG